MVRKKVLWSVSNYIFKVSLTWVVGYDLKKRWPTSENRNARLIETTCVILETELILSISPLGYFKE